VPCGPEFAPALGLLCEQFQRGDHAEVTFWRLDPRLGAKRTYYYWSNSYLDYQHLGPGPRHAEHAGDENARIEIEGESKDCA
jgi:hypothetical protein